MPAGRRRRGGVTTIVTRPDTDPAIDTPEALEFIHRARKLTVWCMSCDGRPDQRRAGREMAEIGLLRDAGAVAFTDVDHTVADSRLYARALTYARGQGALVIGHPQTPACRRARWRRRASSPL